MQTKVNLYRGQSFAGMIVKDRLRDAFTGVSDNNSGDLKYGDLVYISAVTETGIQVKKCDATSTRVDGVVAHEHREAGTIAKGQTVPVLVKGVVWVDNTEGAIVGLAEVFFDRSEGKLSTVSASKSVGDLVLGNSKFLQTAAEGVLVPLEIGLALEYTTHA